MKVKELREELLNFNDDAEIKVVYSHKDNKKVNCYFQHIDTLEYNQNLIDDKIKVDESTLLVWLGN